MSLELEEHNVALDKLFEQRSVELCEEFDVTPEEFAKAKELVERIRSTEI